MIAEPPATKGWEDLREAARGCRACPLWREATQTVFGEGPHFAKMMLVGEQPGDGEDRGGGPFVGPAEKLLDKALEEAGVNRASVYLTNVVKHFKWSVGNTGFIKSQTAAILLPAARGWKLSCTSFNRSTKGAGLYGATAASAIFGPSVRILVIADNSEPLHSCEKR